MLRLLLHIWGGCGGLLNGVAVADVKRCRRGEPPYRALSQDEPASTASALVPAMLSRPLGAAHAAMLRGASLWAAECGTHVIWPCGGVRPREMRVEGRRRRRRPWKRPMPINKCSCCCVVLEATIDRILKKSARPPLSTTPYRKLLRLSIKT